MGDFVVRSLFFFVILFHQLFKASISCSLSSNKQNFRQCKRNSEMSLYIPYSFGSLNSCNCVWSTSLYHLEQLFGFQVKHRNLVFLERKQEVAERLDLPVRNILTSLGKTLGVGFEYAGMQVKSFLLTSGHSTRKFILIKYIFKYL